MGNLEVLCPSYAYGESLGYDKLDNQSTRSREVFESLISYIE